REGQTEPGWRRDPAYEAMLPQASDSSKNLMHKTLCAPYHALVQCWPMVEPRVVPRAEHSISRRDIDPDALKVLYRLRQFEHTAYLVGGSVRDLLLGR